MPISSQSPYIIYDLMHECGEFMRRNIKRYNNGKVQSATYFCDKCKYGWELSIPYSMGQMIKYEPEVVTAADIAAVAVEAQELVEAVMGHKSGHKKVQ